MSVVRMVAVLGLSAVLGAGVGCSVPSLHGAYTPDKAVDDAGLAGTWVSDDGDVSVEVQRSAPADFRVVTTMADDDEDDAKEPQVMRLDVRLVKLGEFTFADLVPSEDDRQKLVKAHNALAIRTHQCMRYQRDGDTVNLWMPDYDRFRTLLERGDSGLAYAKLDEAKGGPDMVITAPTADIQRFLAAHGGDKELFPEPLVLKRKTKP